MNNGIEVNEHVVLVEKDNGHAACALARLADFAN
jgi:hypothetical protein